MARPNSTTRGEKKNLGKNKRSTSTTRSKDDPLDDAMAGVLYLTTHSDKPEVQELARKANIDLSGFSGPVGPSFNDFSNSIKGLVSMGLDTDDNLNLMFGSAKSVRNMQQEIRMGVLFGAAPGATETCSSALVDPEKPASIDILRLLPRWQRSLTKSEKDDHCAICHETMLSPAQALHGCMHIFHQQCIANWLAKKSTCPVCKRALPRYAPRPPSAQELEQLDLMAAA